MLIHPYYLLYIMINIPIILITKIETTKYFKTRPRPYSYYQNKFFQKFIVSYYDNDTSKYVTIYNRHYFNDDFILKSITNYE